MHTAAEAKIHSITYIRCLAHSQSAPRKTNCTPGLAAFHRHPIGHYVALCRAISASQFAPI